MTRQPEPFKRWVIAAAVLLNALVLATMGAALHHNYQNDEINAEITTNNLLLVLREQITDNFQRIDLALQTVAADIQAEIEHDGMQDAHLQRLLTNVLQQFLDVSAVGLVDSKGRVRMRTDAGTEPPLSQTDLEQFGNLRDRHQAGLVVAAPVLTRMGHEWVIPLTRPLHRTDGRLIGVVYAYVSLTRLRELFSTLDVGPNGTIVLRDSELRLVLRQPSSAAFEPGRREVSAELQKRILSGQTSGRYKAVQPVDGIERLYVFSQIKAYPYYLIAGRASADYQAQWRRDAVLMALMTLLFVSGSALAVGLILRQRARQQTAYDALQESQAMLSAILENVGASVFVKDSQYRFVFANKAVCDFVGVTGMDQMVGRTDESFYSLGTVARLRASDRRVIEEGETVRSVNRLTSTQGRSKYTLSVRIPMRQPDGGIYGLCGMATDVTELMRIQRHEKVRSQVLEMLARHQPLPHILEALARGIENEDTDLRCAIVLADGNPKRLRTVAAPSLLSSGRHDAGFFQNLHTALKDTGHWQGELWNRRKNGDLYAIWMSVNTVGHVGSSALRRVSLFTDITERKQADELAWRHANFDLLTQLPNRRLFFDRLQHEMMRAQRDASQLALLLIDLDQFKNINDLLGHALGDALLRETAQRLENQVRETDTVARLGADEFAIILTGLDHAKELEPIVRNLLEALRYPYQINDTDVLVTASIGIAFFPQDGKDPQEMLRNADQAMHAAKGQGRNGFSYFTAQLQQEVQQHWLLLADLRQALARGQLALAYQPIINLHSGQLYKAEALLRWHHPQHGPISPAVFIPLAEESGEIHAISDWVLETALRDAQAWFARTNMPLKISVNVSPVQFSNEDFPARWLARLQQRETAGSSIDVEITEGILVRNQADVARKLEELRAAGISVSLDDFGTGYSSLSYIKRFDIDVLKIDQSFVRDMADDRNSQALVEAMIVMAHKLGLKVVAEGIETAGQRDLLTALGCDYGQGFLFSRPVPAADFELLLAQRQAPAFAD